MSAWSDEAESTGSVPERSFEPVPSAFSVQSVLTAVPPLLFPTALRRWSCGGMSSFVMVQVASPPIPTVMFEPFCVPP